MTAPYPDKLFHYTSLETLALILATKKLKFTLLSELNDPLEGKTPDFQQAERMIYSSSWTANSSDTLPMWKMYSDLRGVRISLPPNMFDTKGPIQQGEWPPAIVNYAELKRPLRPKLNCAWNGNRLVGELKQIMGPDKVEYVDSERVGDIPKVITNCAGPEGEMPVATLSHVGLHKSRDWEFEAEWRFRLPYGISFGTINQSPLVETFNLLTFEDTAVFAELKKSVFGDMRVMLGPKAGQGEEVLLRALLDKYAPTATCERSKIQVR